STTVSGINIDQVAPSLSGAPTSAANADGWYNGDVTIHWTATDALSGIDPASVPADKVVTGEGGNLSASASVSDKAGNRTNTTVSGIKIDRTAPTTEADPPSDWSNADVTVQFTADDNLSGVKDTHYKLDGGADTKDTSVTISAEGDHTLTFWSVDKAGNIETARTVHVKIDKQDPTISHALTPPANGNGWNNTDVTVAFTCGDSLSGVESCTTLQMVTTEGENQPVTGTAVDKAGNQKTDTAYVYIDKMAPTISGEPDRAANNNHWYNANVTVNFTCSDDRSGSKGGTEPQTLSEGKNQSVSGTATDAAGNSASTSVGGINVDKTAPTLSGAPTNQPNAAGWYKGDVTIHWTAVDVLSGVDLSTVPADSVIDGNGGNLGASASVSDLAGNSGSGAVSRIKSDRAAPKAGISAPSDWVNSSVKVKLDAADSLSGVKGTSYKLDGGAVQAYDSNTGIVIATQGIHTIEFWSEDNAGNVESATTAKVKIDMTA